MGIRPAVAIDGMASMAASVAASGDQAFFDWTASFIPLIVTIVALMAIALVAFAKVGPYTELTTREKALRVLVIVAAALFVIALVTRNGYWMAIIWPIMAVCIVMFLLRWLAPQLPAAVDAAGRVVSEKKRVEHEETVAAQAETGARGDALESVLGKAVDERGDTQLVEDAAVEDDV